MSKTEESYEENKLKDEVVQVHCIECKRETRHKIITSYDYNGKEFSDDHGWSVEWSASHQVIQCQGCMTSSFRKTDWFSEDVQQIGPDEWEDGATVTLYPKRSSTTIPARNFWEVPNNLRKIYIESIECYNNDSLILSAVGLRAVVEGLCAVLKVTDGPVEVPVKGEKVQIKRLSNLVGKIAGLHEKGFLTEQNAEVLHEHRYLGNTAIHELAPPTKEELSLAINIIEHAFETIFEIPEKGKKLRVQRALKNKKTRR